VPESAELFPLVVSLIGLRDLATKCPVTPS